MTDLRTIDTDGMRKTMIETATTGQDFKQCAEKYAFDANLLKIKCELDLDRLPNWLNEHTNIILIFVHLYYYNNVNT